MVHAGLAAAILASAVAPCGASRNSFGGPSDDISSYDYGWKTCTFETREDRPLCDKYLEDARFQKRVKHMLVDVAQTVRRASDKLTEDTWSVQKLWEGAGLTIMRTELRFLTHVCAKMPSMAAVLQTPIKTLRKSKDFDVPVSMLPVAVEVWGKDWGDKFIGSAGLTLEPTKLKQVKKSLRPDPHHFKTVGGPVEGGSLGSVTVEYAVERSQPLDCEPPLTRAKCVEIHLKLRCIAAEGLPAKQKTFCKLRLKKDAVTLGAEKLLTKTAIKSFDPVYKSESWYVKWAEPLMTSKGPEAADTLVPATLDELTIAEQLHTMLYTLEEKAIIDENKCKGEIFFVTDNLCDLLRELRSMARDARKFNSQCR